ncbi:hypothetical protein BDD12DRAFT_876059 [Trichophaea hybrida]|nr:hypothetical protein BDD12DRAFT_876059 [Trichophaea hybrida]
MDERLQLQYMKVKDAKELWKQPTVDYKAKVMPNTCGIWTMDTWAMPTDTQISGDPERLAVASCGNASIISYSSDDDSTDDQDSSTHD